MKILIDMNLSRHWAAALMDRGVEALYWSEFAPADAPDIEIMTYAAQNGYTVLTRDLDFGTLLASTHVSHPSVIQIRATDARPEAMLDRVVNVLNQLAADIEQGSLITVDPHKTRIHILPFTP
jgi:predicted nuclease of predicted toxin-antitoxin system